jgi:hypothetical protein
MKLVLGFLVLSCVAFASDLEGVWQGVCEPQSQGYLKPQLTVKGNTYFMLILHSQSATCDSPTVRIESTGTFWATEPTIDYVSGPTLMTPLSSTIALTMNVLGLCGVRNWKANTTVDVSGKTCDGVYVTQVGQSQYNRYEIQGRYLYAGRLTSLEDGMTPETRPKEIDRDRYMELLP